MNIIYSTKIGYWLVSCVRKMKINKHMKKLLLVFATVLITVSGFAQRTADIGIWGGTTSYIGDLKETVPFNSFNPAFGAYFRNNFNSRIAVRAMLLFGSLSESGEIEGEPWEFNKSVQDLSFQVEINYLKYILGKKNTPYTSYVTAGFGVAYFPYSLDPAEIALFNPDHNKGKSVIDETEIVGTIPFGIGFKYSLSHRLGVGIEYQMRKLLGDKLDNLNDPLAHFDSEGNEVVYNTSFHNNDWMNFLGVHVTYKIYVGAKACPAYDSKLK